MTIQTRILPTDSMQGRVEMRKLLSVGWLIAWERGGNVKLYKKAVA